MSAELTIDKAQPRKSRKGTADRVRQALLALACGKADFIRHTETPWASITFSGARHSIDLVFDGPVAVLAGETFIADLPTHEFAIPGQLVADADVRFVNHTILPQPRMEVRIELLLLLDA
ncbi:hypothetical protein [Allopontixanthobacter confluentis]|uniref:hypothetical protein n=1 Tax=Allopontixanthobacter confluentis TaxID=1849021 RepID=UPI001927CC3F|nr:hypothetical protein [Allopontixanthobacter confluentis]